MYTVNRVPYKRQPIVLMNDEDLINEGFDNFSIGSRVKRGLKHEKRAAKVDKKRAKNEARRERAKSRADARRIRAESRGRARETRAQAKLTKSEASQTLADQGIVDTSQNKADQIGDKVLGTIGQIFAKNQQTGEVMPLQDSSVGMTKAADYESPEQLTKDNDVYEPGKPAKNNTMLYLIIGAVAVAGFVMFRKK